MLTGDFIIVRHFKLTQLIKLPTRGSNILDKILTNLHYFYNDPNCLSPFGLSDHCPITVFPKKRSITKSERIKVLIRDVRPSKKQKLGRFLSSIDWSVLSTKSVDNQATLFNKLIHLGLNNIMPEKTRVINPHDVPWIVNHLKELIVKQLGHKVMKLFSSFIIIRSMFIESGVGMFIMIVGCVF